ncbi:hypothetical protein VNO77_37327 [Canavalia gladiata]|uniref:Uncharacterized protein n=1 Tax=Canavalia gladiata TaxID=3824 RepID=A0AAN9PX27_CANGL
MQIALQNQTEGRRQLPPKMSSSGYKKERFCVGHTRAYLGMSPRSKPACTCLNRPGLVQCVRCGYVVPGERLKKSQGNKEVLRRALIPPPTQRIGLRWLNFRPIPSRLSNMSTA